MHNRYCVDIYNRRGHAKITEDEKDQQKSESGHEEEDSESQLDPSSVRCENWFKVVYGCVSFNSKRSDLSNCLTKIVAKMADQVDNQMEIDDEEEDNDGVDYKAIYHFLAHLFANKYPKELEKREALVLLSLIENLTNNIHDIDTTSEESVIKSASWWKTEDSENTANNLVKQSLPSHQTDDNTAHQAKRPTEDNPMSCSSLSEEEESSLTSYFDLPKIRKIRECLNPLKIPVNLLANEHRLLSLFFE